MTLLRTFVFLAAAAVAFTGCESAPEPAPEAPDPNVMTAAANALDEAFVDAFNRGDAEGMVDLYWHSPEVVSFPPDTLQARGIDAVRTATRRMFTAMKGAKLELTESHQMPVGDMVIGWGLFRITMPAADGSQTEMVGRYTDIKALRNGRWVYVLDHGSMPMPAPAAPSTTM